jgi:hypothetical protein
MSTLLTDGSINCFGWYTPKYDFLCIRDNLFTGDDKTLRTGDHYQLGRLEFIQNVLIHEMVHSYLYNVKKIPCTPDFHGKDFAAECNRINQRLGWREVIPRPQFRTMMSMGDAFNHLLFCDYWPHESVPSGYYGGAFLGEYR